MHSEIEKSYMAGFLDGEGYIGISLLATPNGIGRHTLIVTLTNTHIPTLKALARLWGGKVLGFRKRKEGYTLTADLRWCTNAAVEMLKEIYPYLRVKAKDADIAFAFATTIRPRESRTVPITKQEWEYRESLREQIRALHKRPIGERLPPPSKPVLTCQYCGDQFDSYQKLRKYCSRKCSMDAGRDAYVDRHTYQRMCPACGKIFIARLKQKYCSVSCGRQMQAPPVSKGTKRAYKAVGG